MIVSEVIAKSSSHSQYEANHGASNLLVMLAVQQIRSYRACNKAADSTQRAAPELVAQECTARTSYERGSETAFAFGRSAGSAGCAWCGAICVGGILTILLVSLVALVVLLLMLLLVALIAVFARLMLLVALVPVSTLLRRCTVGLLLRRIGTVAAIGVVRLVVCARGRSAVALVLRWGLLVGALEVVRARFAECDVDAGNTLDPASRRCSPDTAVPGRNSAVAGNTASRSPAAGAVDYNRPDYHSSPG